MLHILYAAVTRWRRAHAQPRRLGRPVVSIGNIAAGGRAKTPMTELVARVLLRAGERPAILSRGYARARNVDTPVVVRDAAGMRAGLDVAGDEPLMLAEHLDGAIVVAGADRARAAAAAEALGATVHLLDDGFQHLRVARDLDIVMIEPRDLEDEVFPSGRLREPIDALDRAGAIVVVDGDAGDRESVRDGLSGLPGVRLFAATRRVSAPPPELAGVAGFLVSGIAGNAQFVSSAQDAGWKIAGLAGFADHHRYSASDAASIARQAGESGAAFVVTTAKDAVRLRGVWESALPLHVARMALAFDSEGFEPWLIETLEARRRARAAEDRRRLEDGARRAS